MTNRQWPITPIVYVCFLLIPLYWLINLAFKSESEILQHLTFWPSVPTLANFMVIFSARDWSMGYVNACIYVVMNMFLTIGVALPAAYAFSRGDFLLKKPLFFSFLLFRLIAPIILVVPFTEIFYGLGLFDTHLGVALAHCYFNVPVAVWILKGAVSSVPREVDESALIDGYSLLGFFARILIPTIASGIAVAAFCCFMFSWVEYVLSGALTAVAAKPISGLMSRAGDVGGVEYGLLAAVSVLGFIPGLLCILAVRRFLTQGFSLGRPA